MYFGFRVAAFDTQQPRLYIDLEVVVHESDRRAESARGSAKDAEVHAAIA